MVIAAASAGDLAKPSVLEPLGQGRYGRRHGAAVEGTRGTVPETGCRSERGVLKRQEREPGRLAVAGGVAAGRAAGSGVQG